MEEQNQQPVQQPVQETPQEPPKEAPKEPVNPVPTLELDERTGRKRVVLKTPEEPKEEPKEEPPQEPVQNPAPPVKPEEPKPGERTFLNTLSNNKPYYKPDEMMLAMQLGRVDESRVPPEFKAQYEATKPKPPTQEEAEKAIREKIQAMAKKEAMAKSGATEEDLSLGDFSDDEEVQKRVQDYKTAYELAQQAIIRDSLDKYQRMRAEEDSRREVMQNVKNFIDEQRAKEPHFDDIGKLMETKFLEMPFQQAAVIEPVLRSAVAGTLNAAQAKVLGDYYEFCRKDLYAQINKTSVTPQPIVPKVEGKGAGLSTEQHADFAKLLREASVREKPRILADWIRTQKEK